MSAFRMYLRIVSDTLQPDDISRRLGAEPDDSHAIGSRRRPQSNPRRHSSWLRHARSDAEPARPEDLEPTVIGWGPEFAAALGRLADSGEATVSLVIVQEIRDVDDEQQKGIWLGSELVAWLAAARAGLEIDQYVLHECEADRIVTESRPGSAAP